MNRPKIFLVEDDPDQQVDILAALEKLPLFGRQLYGIEDVFIKSAENARVAEKLMGELIQNGEPYDILLLDLAIPYDDENNADDPQNGLNLLNWVNKVGAAKEIIIYTHHPKFEYALSALRGGVVDFIDKSGCEPDELLPYILSVLGRLIAKESANLLEKRVRDLIPYAEKGLAHRFTAIFSTLLNSVIRTTGEIEKYARERYGLDVERDAQDALIRQLRIHRGSVSTARQEWAKLHALLPSDDERPQVEMVEDLLNEIKERLLPCLTVKKMSILFDLPHSDKSPVLTFQQDVQAVFKEVIIGGLSKLPDYSDRKNITVTIEHNDTRVIVCFKDDLETIPKEDRDKINAGYSIVPDTELGRAWGLSIAQHIALRGGGELSVKPQTDGNLITYSIPRANNA